MRVIEFEKTINDSVIFTIYHLVKLIAFDTEVMQYNFICSLLAVTAWLAIAKSKHKVPSAEKSRKNEVLSDFSRWSALGLGEDHFATANSKYKDLVQGKFLGIIKLCDLSYFYAH